MWVRPRSVGQVVNLWPIVSRPTAGYCANAGRRVNNPPQVPTCPTKAEAARFAVRDNG